MLIVAEPVLAAIRDAAAAAYPEECCGLLAGRLGPAGDRIVSRAEASPNVTAQDPKTSFEVDPAVRFRLMRRLEGTEDHIIGHYHSHPDHPATPSVRDLSQAYEPEMIWLIVSVERMGTADCRAHLPVMDEGGAVVAFDPVDIRIVSPGEGV